MTDSGSTAHSTAVSPALRALTCGECGYVHKATAAGYERMKSEYPYCLSCAAQLVFPVDKPRGSSAAEAPTSAEGVDND